jgi:predicted dehydrogenase
MTTRLQTLIVGLGRSGRGLHLPVLTRLRGAADSASLPMTDRIVGYDPAPTSEPPDGVTTVTSLAQARELLRPADTVVHLCTPPGVRLELLRELAELGFRRILVEKPLANDPLRLAQIVKLRRAYGLQIIVVAPWLASALTLRLMELIDSGVLGVLRSIVITQSKPRLRRTLGGDAHPNILDVEIPHSAGVALHLAGPGEVCDASWTDLRVGEQIVPRMATTSLVLRHYGGAATRIVSDLTSPVRQRRIGLRFSRGRVLGYYPAGEDDNYAHLRISVPDQGRSRELFADDSLSAFLRQAYTAFATGADLEPAFDLSVRVSRLIGDARELCRAGELVASPTLPGSITELTSRTLPGAITGLTSSTLPGGTTDLGGPVGTPAVAGQGAGRG